MKEVNPYEPPREPPEKASFRWTIWHSVAAGAAFGIVLPLAMGQAPNAVVYPGEVQFLPILGAIFAYALHQAGQQLRLWS